MNQTESAIDSYLSEHLDDYIAETSTLCAQPSISAISEGMEECADLVVSMLERRDFDVTRFETEGNPIIVAHADGESPRTLLFYNHYDVQPPEPLELWTDPPFEPTVRDGALYARGSVDDKGELVARLAGVDAIREANGGKLPCGVTFIVEGEEEIGSPHIKQFVQEHLDILASQGSIWEQGYVDADGRPINTLGVRGILAIEMYVKSMEVDAHSGGAHMFPNAAWRLVRALDILKDDNEHVLIPGFYDGALPASELDESLFEAMDDPEPRMREEYGVPKFVRGLSGVDLERAVFSPTCNIQGITTGYQGGGMKTVIPHEASAKLDFRLVPFQDPAEIFKKLRTYLDAQGFADVEVRWLGAMWPEKVELSDPLVQLCINTGRDVYEKEPTVHPLVGGSSPIYAFARPLGGIPVIRPGVGHTGCRTHAPDEHVRLDNFLNAARHIARILDSYGDL